MAMTANPYAPPRAELGPDPGDSAARASAVALRTEHLNHEAGVRSIGILYFLNAGLFALIVPFGLWMMSEDAAVGGLMAGFAAAVAAVSVWAGLGIRRLDPGIRLVVGILSGIGLLNPPVGTLINGYILYLVFGAKGKVVFSDEYARARALTPDMQYRTPLLVKACAALLLLTVVAGVVTALMAP